MTYKCKSCLHYGFYQMITRGAYGYAGDIPCDRCLHFTMSQDNYQPAEYKWSYTKTEKDNYVLDEEATDDPA